MYGLTVLSGFLGLLAIWPITYGRTIGGDSVKFHYGGVLLARGYAPYLHFWDIKPPMIYYVTAALAWLAPNDPWTQFYLGSFLTMAASVATIVLAALLVDRRTRGQLGAVATGLTILSYSTFLFVPSRGIMPKFYAFAFGLAGVYCVLDRRRYLLGAALATVSAGFWQFGAVFVGIALGEVLRRREYDRVAEMVGVCGGVTLLVVAPIVLRGGGVAMLNQVVFTPIQGDEGVALAERLHKLYGYTLRLWPLYGLGVVGSLAAAYRDRRNWWVTAGVGWTLLQLLRLDFDTQPDVMLFVVFAAMGVGLLVGRLRKRDRLVVSVLVVLMAANGLVPAHEDFTGRHWPEQATRTVDRHFIDQRVPPESCMVSMAGYDTWSAGKARLPQTCSDERLGRPNVHGD